MDRNYRWFLEIVTIIIVFVIGLVGNIFVLIIVHKKNTRTTVHGIFVSCLAAADLVLLCFDSPVSILSRFDVASEIFNCRVHTPVTTTAYNAVFFTITSMAMHRCHIVTHPWRPKLKRKGAIIWVSLIWLAAFILVIPLFVVMKSTENGCEEIWPTLGHRQAYTASLMTTQYIMPLLITAICYIRIWLFLKSRPVLPNNSGLTTARETPGEENTRESIVILKTVAVIVLLFLVFLLPNQVAWMLLDFRNVSYYELWFASGILTKLHSCLNPVVYGVMNKQYRRSYVIFLSRILCCSRSSCVLQPLAPRPLDHHVPNQTACNDAEGQQMPQYPQENTDGHFTESHL